MNEVKLGDDVIKQIKDFDHWYLTGEQRLLIDKLILDERLKKLYIDHGLCKECKQPNTDGFLQISWCQQCNYKHFQQNFKNWTSENNDVDEFIQKTQRKATAIEWIEYDRFNNVEYLTKGGFGTTFKAIWKDGHIESWDSKSSKWRRNKVYEEGYPVVLKCLNDSQNVTTEFLRNFESQITMNNSDYIIKCYGITKDPETNNIAMVMECAKNGSLRQYLNNKFNSMNWKSKLYNLHGIAHGLSEIHDNEMIHRNLHCGNVLIRTNDVARITDLGSYQPTNVEPSQDDDKKIYGVLPYVAPEILRGEDYTQASDIYGFGIVAYEICIGLPPYHDIAHDESLAIKICQGLRPKSNYKVPQLILDIIKQCWDADPLKRLKAKELNKSLYDLYFQASRKNSLIDKQIGDARRTNKKLSLTAESPSDILSYTTHSQAVYTSRILDFKNLPEPKNADGNDNSVETKHPESCFTKSDVNSKDESN